MKIKNKSLIEDFKVATYFLNLIYKISKGFLSTVILSCLVKAIIPFINIIFPKYIMDELIGDKDIYKLMTYIIFMVLLNFTFYFIKKYLEEKVLIKNEQLMLDFELDIGKKLMSTSYCKLEDSNFLDLKEQALFPILKQNILITMMENGAEVITQIIILIGLITVIATINFYIVIILLVISIIYLFNYRKSQEIAFLFNKKLIPINRKFTYYIHLVTDYSRAKDIRLYDMEPLITSKIKKYNKETYKELLKLSKSDGKYGVISQLNLSIQLIMTYAYMSYKVIKGSITIGEFSMYINSIKQFSDSINLLIKRSIDFRQECNYLKSFVELDKNISSEKYAGINAPDVIESIEFRDVSFKYPNTENYSLKNVSLKMNKGEKLAIVGLNGAGKTTFIKLLLRLYQPTGGQILINGINIEKFRLNSYLSKMSAVFQDFSLLAFSIKENISLNNSENVKDEDIIEVLKRLGMDDVIKKLKNGVNTQLNKSYSDDGIELSGGQNQKLAIARLIFKNTPIMILDEPTSALDPVSECDIYSKFEEVINKGSEDKISIFISHRLISCKFCDYVAVFNKGEVVEYGKHNILLKDDSLYSEMWNAQAQYYIE